MGSIARAAQQAQMVNDLAALLKTVESLSRTIGFQELDIVMLRERIEALEQKRGPGRPPKSDV